MGVCSPKANQEFNPNRESDWQIKKVVFYLFDSEKALWFNWFDFTGRYRGLPNIAIDQQGCESVDPHDCDKWVCNPKRGFSPTHYCFICFDKYEQINVDNINSNYHWNVVQDHLTNDHGDTHKNEIGNYYDSKKMILNDKPTFPMLIYLFIISITLFTLYTCVACIVCNLNP